MGRSIVAVIVGYIAMFVLSVCAFMGAYVVLGADQAFRPHSFQPSKRWMLMSLVVHLVVGMIGGFLCVVIAKGGKAPLVLALVVLVLGILLTVPSVMMMKNKPDEIRRGFVPMLEAMQKAKQPVLVLIYPIIGAVGVVIGGKLKRQVRYDPA
jgi:hypothetical protein